MCHGEHQHRGRGFRGFGRRGFPNRETWVERLQAYQQPLEQELQKRKLAPIAPVSAADNTTAVAFALIATPAGVPGVSRLLTILRAGTSKIRRFARWFAAKVTAILLPSAETVRCCGAV